MTEVKSSLNVSNELEKIFEVDKGWSKKEKKNKITPHYKSLVEKVNQDIEKGILNIDLEIYIQPRGVCEGIAYAVGCLDELKRSQLRKFFNEIKAIEYDLKKEEKNIKEIQIKILALISKLAYAKGRKLIGNNFYDFMKTILMKVKEDMNKEDPQKVFEVFVKILESIVAYHIYHFQEA